jgi:uncharacterized membrane protein
VEYRAEEIFILNENTIYKFFMKDSHFKSLLKGFTWRVLGTLDTMLLAYLFTGNTKMALSIGGTEFFTKICLYYFHERLWQLPSPFNKTTTPLSDRNLPN